MILVGHDWGGALAFDWAARHPGRVRGLAFFETILRPLSWADYPTVESRRPLLAWPRATPIDGEPADVVARAEAYDAWLAACADVPRLLLTFEGSPTLMIGPALEAWCRENIAAREVVACGPAGHLALEDRPEAIGDALVAWLNRTLAVDSRA